MVIWFRVDASLDIGIGHVVRCLTLADMLVSLGAECCFVCKAHEGNLIDTIAARGFTVYPLSLVDGGCGVNDGNRLSHASWLGGGWRTDADQTLALMKGRAVDWIVVDHYALDQRWEMKFRNDLRKILVIDDLADRYHDCDLLLDQTFGRLASVYQAYVPDHCTVLSGSKYAMLRPEFSLLRSRSLEQRKRLFSLRRLFISFGGVDTMNITGRVIAALEGNYLPENCKITVVMGAFSPWLSSIKAQAQDSRLNVDVLVDVSNMAELIAKSDLAIGAAGGTTWERCCLGVPSILMVLAENQREAASVLNKEKVAMIVEVDDSLDYCIQQAVLRVQSDSRIVKELSHYSSKVTDGRGCSYVSRELFRISLK